MKHLALALGLFVCASVAGAQDTNDDPKILSLDTISAYFNGFETAQSPFTQISDDGVEATGTLYLHRPGRMRFEYDPPNEAVVVSGGQTVVIFDSKSNQAPESYPLRRTPLSIVLARKVDLADARMVVGHSFDGQRTVVVAQDPKNPEYGHIELVFTDDPVRLTQWVIQDNAGGRTLVVLDDLETGLDLDNNLFNPRLVGDKTGR